MSWARCHQIHIRCEDNIVAVTCSSLSKHVSLLKPRRIQVTVKNTDPIYKSVDDFVARHRGVDLGRTCPWWVWSHNTKWGGFGVTGQPKRFLR